MNYEVIQSVNAKTAAGNTQTVPIGAILDIDPAKAARLVKEGKLKPFTPKKETAWENLHPQGMPAARRESLIAVMEAVWTSEFQGIINRVLTGKAMLADFKEATVQWAKMCAREFEALTINCP
jgi:hypothetical protein